MTKASSSGAQAVFHAISEPTRRRLLDELRRGPSSAGALAARFPSSRPGIARHLRVLRAAGLVRTRPEGRRRIYRLAPAPLRAVRDWVAAYGRFWKARLGELADYVEKRSGGSDSAKR